MTGDTRRGRRRPPCLVVAAQVAIVLGLAGCGSENLASDPTRLDSTVSTTTAAEVVTLTSIPFCVEEPLADDDEIANPTAEQLEAMERYSLDGQEATVVALYEDDPAWVGLYIDRANDNVVFQFTDRDEDREQRIEELFVHPHLSVAFEVKPFSTSDLETAQDALLPYVGADGAIDGVYIVGTGYGKEAVVYIGLNDVSRAADFAADFGISPPYEIYCITPRSAL